MRLGIDASNLSGGGGLTHLSELLKASEPHQQGITQVVVWGGRRTLSQIPARQWLDRVHEPMLDLPLPMRLYWRTVRLPRLAGRTCDLLFVPGGGYAGTVRPFVVMSRNLLPFEKAEMHRFGLSWVSLRLMLLRRAHTRSFSKADGVIFLTEYARSVVLGELKGVNGRSTIIPHGIDGGFFRSPRRQEPIEAYSRSQPLRCLYVSIVDMYKHQWHVVEAVARLRQKGIPLVLDLVGPAYPPALRRLRQVIRRVDPEEEFIRYRGPVPYSELASCYHEADVFVFASSCENMPNILLEAMAGGLPIASSKRGPMPEVLGEAGVYFDHEDPRGIAEALQRLIEDPAFRERCAGLAHQRAQKYSWKLCARETLSFLVEVARHRSVASC